VPANLVPGLALALNLVPGLALALYQFGAWPGLAWPWPYGGQLEEADPSNKNWRPFSASFPP